ncbi:NAD+ kinase [Nitrosomonas communis]|uniref:NAD+ kinase n=2 Tax=Nitrosomonadaceae TaxID=206379 RepID=A0A0F7KFI7_9PROT|nr:hypothetical protein AAW31_06550 [Nitrosomonas communis]TYP78470.1 NAD+ kinase [Nitrosomonas communis]
MLIEPPTIIPWLSDEERSANIILLDFDVDVEDLGTLRVELNVVFNPKSVRRGSVNRVDYYIGCTGAEIIFEATQGTILQHTQEATLDVNYTNSTSTDRKVALNLAPAIKEKNDGAQINVALGTINRKKGKKQSTNATFQFSERYLATIKSGNNIRWVISLPRGEKVIRDFLIGNLYLFASCDWQGVKKAGRVTIRPSDVVFFDSNRKPLESRRTLMMKFVLWYRNDRIKNWDGFTICFEEAKSGN